MKKARTNMANHKDKKTGETLVRIAAQAFLLHEYITDEKSNGGKIQLGTLKAMSNVIVSNIKLLEESDKIVDEKLKRNLN